MIFWCFSFAAGGVLELFPLGPNPKLKAGDQARIHRATAEG